jgi:hypothetical protein
MQARSLTGHQHYTFFKSVTPNFEFSFLFAALIPAALQDMLSRMPALDTGQTLFN